MQHLPHWVQLNGSPLLYQGNANRFSNSSLTQNPLVEAIIVKKLFIKKSFVHELKRLDYQPEGLDYNSLGHRPRYNVRWIAG